MLVFARALGTKQSATKLLQRQEQVSLTVLKCAMESKLVALDRREEAFTSVPVFAHADADDHVHADAHAHAHATMLTSPR